MSSITVSSPERWYIDYTQMLSPFNQYVINVFLSLPIRRHSGVFMNVSAREHDDLKNWVSYVAKLTILTPLLIVS